jgi:hypothetical protein
MSDIPTDPMSHNDPIKDIASLEADAISEGYAEGFRDGQAEVLPILLDLLAELREQPREVSWDTGRERSVLPAVVLDLVLDRAEALLREVGGDE